MKKRAKSVAPCSHAEFESLPEPLRRKYFSSLERLRIAEEHALHEQQGEHKDKSKTRPSRARSIALQRPLSILPLGPSRRRFERAESLKHDYYVAQADASFFLSLPPKIQRTAFSPEEQTILIGRCDFPTSSRGSRYGSPLPPARRPQLQQDEKQRFQDFRFGFQGEDLSSPPRGRSPERRRSTISTADDVSPTRALSFGPVQKVEVEVETGSTLSFDIMSPFAPPSSSRTSFRRTLSLTHIPMRSSSSAASIPPEPLSARGAAPWHQRTHSQSLSGRRISHTPQAPVFDPEATHYRDVETRKKLQFLASPQKFDEAVEFGFPATNSDDTLQPRYHLPPISTDARNFSRDVQSFLRDDRISFLEDNENENEDENDDADLESDIESIAEFESPVTPSSAVIPFRIHSRKQSSNFSSSIDSNGVPLIHPVTGRINREMTLRMTLTRPDLRADEEQLYGWQGQKTAPPKDDPFALADLPFTDDVSGTKGAFYVKPKPHGNLVSRLFKRSSKKGR